MSLFIVVENVYKTREPVPHMKAIYLITPTKKVSNLKRMSKIFQTEKAILFYIIYYV